MKIAIFTWQGGGATQPAFGIGRVLAARGHEVRIVGPAAYAERARAAGCAYSPFPAELEFDAAKGRAAEDQAGYVEEILLGRGPAAVLAAEVEREPVDLVVVDYLMRSAICRAESLGIPTVLFVHMVHRFYGVCRGGDEAWGWRWQYRRLNQVREDFGLEPLPIGPEPTAIALMRRARATVVAMPAEFDLWPEPAPPNLTHVGPVFEERQTGSWDPPWPDDDRSLAVVTMGSTYMRQEELLTRAAGALGEVGMRVLVLTGSELAADELELTGPEIVVRDFVPHSAVLPQADLVVTHGGMGTLMAAFAAAVPVLCMPLGRDQRHNAELVAELGLGGVLAPDAPPEQIREAARAILGTPGFRSGVEEMTAAIGAYDTEALIVRAVEGAA